MTADIIPYDRFLKAKLKEEMEKGIAVADSSGCVFADLKLPCRHEPACDLPCDVEAER